jgi:hypothetical protein
MIIVHSNSAAIGLWLLLIDPLAIGEKLNLSAAELTLSFHYQAEIVK